MVVTRELQRGIWLSAQAPASRLPQCSSILCPPSLSYTRLQNQLNKHHQAHQQERYQLSHLPKRSGAREARESTELLTESIFHAARLDLDPVQDKAGFCFCNRCRTIKNRLFSMFPRFRLRLGGERCARLL